MDYGLSEDYPLTMFSFRTSILALLVSTTCWSQAANPADPKPDAKPAPLAAASDSTSSPTDSMNLVIVKIQKAVYPDEAAAKKIDGQVVVKIAISETGGVDQVEVVSGDPILAQAAVDAVRNWKFKPYIKNGKPVKVSTKIPFNFPGDNPGTNSPKEPNPTDAAGATSPTTTPQPTPMPIRVRVSQGVIAPMIQRKVNPIYPTAARSAHVQGAVILAVLIGKDGQMLDVKPVSGSPLLIDSAVEAVKQWRYKPYLLNGTPVEVDTQITVIFSLSW